MMPLGILGYLWFSRHPGTLVWQSVGYGVRGMVLHPKEQLYAPAEVDALCMVSGAYNGWIGTGANLPRYQPRSIVSDKVLADQGYKSERCDGTRLLQ